MGRPIKYKERELIKLRSWTIVMDRKGYIVSGPGYNQFFGTFTKAYFAFIDAITRDGLFHDEKIEVFTILDKIYTLHRKIVKQMEHAYAIPFYYDIDREMNEIRRELDELDKRNTRPYTKDNGPVS